MKGRKGVASRLVAITTACALTSCAGHGMRFTEDDRVRIVTPHELSTAAAPVHIRWTTSPALAPSQRFAVFVDRIPVHPGQRLRSLGDDACKRTPGCPDDQYLAQRNVYLTPTPTLDLPTLPIGGQGASREDRHVHKATIIVVDSAGRRIGESAWSVQFQEPADTR